MAARVQQQQQRSPYWQQQMPQQQVPQQQVPQQQVPQQQMPQQQMLQQHLPIQMPVLLPGQIPIAPPPYSNEHQNAQAEQQQQEQSRQQQEESQQQQEQIQQQQEQIRQLQEQIRQQAARAGNQWVGGQLPTGITPKAALKVKYSKDGNFLIDIKPTELLNRHLPNMLVWLLVIGTFCATFRDIVLHQMDFNKVYTVIFIAYLMKAVIENTGMNYYLGKLRERHPVAGKWVTEIVHLCFATLLLTGLFVVKMFYSDDPCQA